MAGRLRRRARERASHCDKHILGRGLKILQLLALGSESASKCHTRLFSLLSVTVQRPTLIKLHRIQDADMHGKRERGESWCAKKHLELCIVMAADFVFEAQKAGRLLSVHVHFCFFFLIMGFTLVALYSLVMVSWYQLLSFSA